jgi:hypothetical protein
MRSLRFGAGLTAVGLALLLSTGVLAAAPAGTLDQSHECAAGGCNSVNGGQPDAQYPLWYSQNGNDGSDVGLGQTFTAGISGSLTGVELYLTALDATTPPTLTVQIESTTSGVPDGTVLATTTVATSDISFTPGWVSATFATPPAVTAGTMYAITLPDLPQADVSPWLVWGLDSETSGAYTDYTGGDAYASVAGSWASMFTILNDGDTGAADLAFRTYVQAPVATPTPTPTAVPTPTPAPSITPPPTSTVPVQPGSDGGAGAVAVILGLVAISLSLIVVRPRRPARSRR